LVVSSFLATNEGAIDYYIIMSILFYSILYFIYKLANSKNKIKTS